ncbi:MAG: GNAT family N-acetyltransferase [Chitinophagales bacterium]
MKILQAKKHHIQELIVLFEGYRAFYKKEANTLKAMQFLEDRIQNKESYIFIAIDSDDKMVGFVQLYPMFSSTRLDRILILNDLFVDANYRGKGISKLLMDRAKSFAKDYNALELVLETQKSNTIGNKLYPQEGFELDTEHNYYSWTNPEYQQ